MMVLAELEQRIIISKECKRLFCCFGWNMATFCSIDAEYLIHTPWNIVFFGIGNVAQNSRHYCYYRCHMLLKRAASVECYQTQNQPPRPRPHPFSHCQKQHPPSLALEIEWTEWQGIVRSIAGCYNQKLTINKIL